MHFHSACMNCVASSKWIYNEMPMIWIVNWVSVVQAERKRARSTQWTTWFWYNFSVLIDISKCFSFFFVFLLNPRIAVKPNGKQITDTKNDLNNSPVNHSRLSAWFPFTQFIYFFSFNITMCISFHEFVHEMCELVKATNQIGWHIEWNIAFKLHNGKYHLNMLNIQQKMWMSKVWSKTYKK